MGNTGLGPLDLTSVRFTDGIVADLSGLAGGPLGPGETVVLAKNAAAFTARYGPGRRVLSGYQGYLDNSGERLRLIDAANEEIADFRYDAAWFPLTDGPGHSLELLAPDLSPGERTSWRASAQVGGTPGSGGTVAPRIHSAALTAERLSIVFVAEAGATYAVERRDSLSGGQWVTAELITATSVTGARTVELVRPWAEAAAFFRIVAREP